MGDIADMMLDGVLCATCGTFLDEIGNGGPAYCCKACKPNGPTPSRMSLAQALRMPLTPRARKAARVNREQEALAIRRRGEKHFCCSECTKRFRDSNALAQHRRDRHGPAVPL